MELLYCIPELESLLKKDLNRKVILFKIYCLNYFFFLNTTKIIVHPLL